MKWVKDMRSVYENREITRQVLERLKEKFNCKGMSDREFLAWYKRNHLTGYEKTITIIEPNGTKTVVRVYP